MDISYMYHPIHIHHFGQTEKANAPTVPLRIIISDYGSGAIGCNPDGLRDCAVESADEAGAKVDWRATR